MWEACGPLLTLILQPLEDRSITASPFVQLFVDLIKHLLHLPRRCLVELLWDRKTKVDKVSYSSALKHQPHEEKDAAPYLLYHLLFTGLYVHIFSFLLSVYFTMYKNELL